VLGLALIVSVVMMATLFITDRLFPEAGARTVVGYVTITGLISAGLAWQSRRPGTLGSMAWLLVAGWAAHVALIIGLLHFGVWDLRELAKEPKPYATLWNSVGVYTVLLLGGDYVLTRVRERTRRDRSAGRPRRGPSDGPA